MPSTEALPTVSEVGGVFALLVLLHFLADWVPQTHSEAMVKHVNWRVRATHCAMYVFPFTVVMYMAGMGWPLLASMTALLFLSHFVEDTYYPVFLWAKYVRRPPQMRWKLRQDGGHVSVIGPETYVGSIPAPRRLRLDSPLPESVDQWAASLIGAVARGEDTVREAQRKLDREGFASFASEPLGKILVIAVDQVVHLCFLVPVAVSIALCGS